MKKIIFSVSIIIASAFLTGCSLLPQTSNTAGFTMAQDIWQSKDGGVTWQAQTKGTGKANLTDFDVLSFAVNPTNGQNVFAGLRSGGILKTMDAGQTWSFVNNFTSEKVYGLVFNPNGGVLYASAVYNGRGKIFATSDGGQNWKEIYTSPSSGPLIISLTVDKNNLAAIYATTSDNEAFKSADNGQTWKNIESANSPILKIVVDSGNSSLLYFATLDGKVSRSQDGGATWEDLSSKISQSFSKNSNAFGGGNFTVVVADPTHPKWVYIAGQGGIALSQDAGETWKKIATLSNPENFPIKTLAIDPTNSQNLIYGAAQTGYRSTDGGITWATSQFTMKRNVNIITYNTSNPNVIYLGFSK